MSIHTMAKQTKSTGKPEDIGELKEEEDKEETPLTLEAQIRADNNVFTQFSPGDWATLSGSGAIFLPDEDIKFIKENIAYSKRMGHTVGCIPVCRLSEESQLVPLGKLRPIILNLVEQVCTIRTRHTGKSNRKAFKTLQIRPSVNKHGKKNDVLKAGGFVYHVDHWTPTIQVDTGVTVSPDGTLYL